MDYMELFGIIIVLDISVQAGYIQPVLKISHPSRMLFLTITSGFVTNHTPRGKDSFPGAAVLRLRPSTGWSSIS
jgi:hypothetical protein